MLQPRRRSRPKPVARRAAHSRSHSSSPSHSRSRSRRVVGRSRRSDAPEQEQAREAEPWTSVRPKRVARARALVKRKNYPPPRVMRAVAKLLAERL